MHSSTDMPENEPTEIIAGDTVKWKRLFDHYKASDSWVLAYVITGRKGRPGIITATADGDKHSITIASSVTTNWVAGDYTIVGYVTKGGEQYTVYEGSLKVKPNLVTATGAYDNRPHVKRVLDAIEATIEGTATKEQASLTIAGRTLQRRTAQELLVLRDRYKAEYISEQKAEKIKNGLATGGKILTRFN